METRANAEGRGALVGTRDKRQMWHQSGHSWSPSEVAREGAQVPAASVWFRGKFQRPEASEV